MWFFPILVLATALMIILFGAGDYNSLSNLHNDGYRYTMSFNEYKRGLALQDSHYLTNVCQGSEYIVINRQHKQYTPISINSHLFHEKNVYLFCEDSQRHVNQEKELNLKTYLFQNSFSYYPSTQLITTYCGLDNAMIVNYRNKPVSIGDRMPHENREFYLYCKRH